jgi:long-chain acyl-CoA synthetase
MLAASAREHPMREALICDSERLNYTDFHAAVSAFADELATLGVAGERVALVLGNSIDLCIAMFAAQSAGAQIVPLNPLYTVRELEPMLRDATPRVLLYSSANAAAIEPLADSLNIAHRIIVGLGRRELAQLRSAAPLALPVPESLAALQYTGGTTGVSKGVNLTHRAIARNIMQRDAWVPSRRDGERILCTMPLFHVYAVAMCLHNAVYCGGTLVIVPRFAPELVLDLLVREQVTAFAGSPTVFTALLAHGAFVTAKFPHLRVSYSGSAALPAAMLARWEAATGAPVVEGYGLSETGPVLTFNPLSGPRKPLSVGRPLPETELQIVDAEDGITPLAVGQIGEIRVRGPQMMLGYRNRPEETAQTLRHGWLYTGDLGELDADGYLFIRDRKKDMFKVSGYTVYPREIEEVLYQHPAVREVAVIGVPDDYRGTLVRALVALRDGIACDAKTLEAFCRERLTHYKLPREFEFVAALPRTAVGKIDKKAITGTTR